MTAEVKNRGAELISLMAEFFPEPVSGPALPPPAISLDDHDVIDRIRRSQQGAKFDRLMAGDASDYGDDKSAADMALCSILAFWCDGEPQTDRLFRQSKLYREKWDERRGSQTYGAITVSKAWIGRTEHYDPHRAAPARVAILPTQPDVKTQLDGLFITARDLASSTPEQVAYIVRGLVALKAITELASKVKTGKSTLLCHLFRAVLNGGLFLGFETQRVSILWLTEERDATIRALLERCGLLDAVDLHILSLHKVRHLTWPERVEVARAKTIEVGAQLVAVDTLSRWADIEDENATSHAQAAMAPLEALAADGMAVIVVRHDRKSGGEVGDSGRGASAFSGAADILIHLQRANVEGHPNRRILSGVGRFDDVPDTLVIELTEAGYVNLGEEIEVERAEARRKLTEVLPGSRDEAILEADIITALEPLSRSTTRRAIEDGLKDGSILREQGFGGRGRAYGYWLKSTDQISKDSGQLIKTHVSDFDVLPSLGTPSSVSDQPPSLYGQEIWN